MHKRLLQVIALVAVIGGCATLPPGSDYPKQPSSALANPETTRLGQKMAAAAREHPQASGFRLLPVGVDGFLTRAQMADAAERTLDVQYFILQGDHTGKWLTDALLRAADRGVHVRILLDDSDVAGRDTRIPALDAHRNIEVRLFNPFAYRGTAFLFRFVEFTFNAPRLDYRMHNKLFVADNAIALTGGRNIGDEYFEVGANLDLGDYDIFVVGPMVKRLSATFDDFWNNATAIPVAALGAGPSTAAELESFRAVLNEHRKAMANSDYLKRMATGDPLAGMLSGKLPLTWARAQLIYDSPEKRRVEKGEIAGKLMSPEVAKLAEQVRSELLIITPYLVPGDDGLSLLRDLRKRNVRVRILTNSLESSSALLAHAGYIHYRLPMLEDGVELWEGRRAPGNPDETGDGLRSASAARHALHAKAIVFDREKVFIGSMNFDQRSLHLNTEIGLIIDSPELARQITERFEAITQPANSYRLVLRRESDGAPPAIRWRTEENGKMIEHVFEPALTPWQRLRAQFLTLLPFDREL